MSFQLNYVAGGRIDEVRKIGHIRSGRWDSPYMPSMTLPYTKGRLIEVPGTYTSEVDIMTFPCDVEFLATYVDTSEDLLNDFWEVYIGDSNYNIMENISVKKYPEGLTLTVAHKIPANTEIKFVFHNRSSKQKKVWYAHQFLRQPSCPSSVISLPGAAPEIKFDPIPTLCFHLLEGKKSFTAKGTITSRLGIKRYKGYVNGEVVFDREVDQEKEIKFTLDYSITIPPYNEKTVVNLKVEAWDGLKMHSFKTTKAEFKHCVPPPTVSFNESSSICYGDLLPDKLFDLDGKILGLGGLTHYKIYKDNNLIDTIPVEGLPTSIDFKRKIPVEFEPYREGLADIVFIVDTSGSMQDDIEGVRNNLNGFKKTISDQGINAQMGYVNSNYKNLNRRSLVPADNFELTLNIDGGGWEGLNWKQVVDPKVGGYSFFPEFREDSKRFFVVLTDTLISSPPPSGIANELISRNTSLSFISEGEDADYGVLAKATGGVLGNIKGSFRTELDKLADRIVAGSKPPEQSVTFRVEAWDQIGLSNTNEITITFKQCE